MFERQETYTLKQDLGTGGGSGMRPNQMVTVQPTNTKQLQADRSTIKTSVLGLLGKLPTMNKGLFFKALYELKLPISFDFSPLYSADVTGYVANFYIKKLNSWLLGQLQGLSAPNNLGDLKSQSHVAGVNKIIAALHIARQYYCFKASRTKDLEQAKFQAKKQIVTTYANWLASALSSAVKTAGGSIDLKATEVKASDVKQGIEVYNWEGETSTAKFNAFAINISTQQKPYEVTVGPTKELPPVIVTTTDFVKGDTNQSGAGSSNNTDNANSGSGAYGSSSNGNGTSEVPDGSQSLINNLTDDAKAIADGKKPSRWWLWLVAAGVGGYILKGGNSKAATNK